VLYCYCTVLYCAVTALYCAVLLLHCIVLYCTTIVRAVLLLHCIVLCCYCTVLCCAVTAMYCTVLYDNHLCCTVQCCSALHFTIMSLQYFTGKHCAVHCTKMLRTVRAVPSFLLLSIILFSSFTACSSIPMPEKAKAKETGKG
jgi:hypothetical protein